MSSWTTERARLASLSRSRDADDPDLIAARRNLKAERLADYIERVVNDAPPLTSEQRERIAALLYARAEDGNTNHKIPATRATVKAG